MKKIAIVLAVLLCLTMSVALVACNSASGELAVPQVVQSGNSFSWEPVANASSYEVVVDNGTPEIINATEKTVITNVVGTHTFKVRAIGEGSFTSSQFSQEFKFYVKSELASPTIAATKEGNIVTFSWNAVDNADHYNFRVGTNVNSSDVIELKETSYQVDITKEGFNAIDEYEADVVAVPVADSQDYSASKPSNRASFVNSRKLDAPTNLKYANKSFSWESADTQSHQFEITVLNASGESVKAPFSNYNKTQSFDGLGIKEPGKYTLSIKAYSTVKRNRVFLDSDEISISFTVLPKVTDFKLDMTNNTLSWTAPSIDGVSANGYTIKAVTSKEYSSSPITLQSESLDNGATTSLNILSVSNFADFKKASNVYKVYTFVIEPKENAEDQANLIIPLSGVSGETYLEDGNYYRYIPKEADYDTDALKEEWKNIKVEPTVEDGAPTYYGVNTYAKFMWALENAGTGLIKMTDNIDLSSSEFISPIKAFNGTFDGDNHIITGIKMTNLFGRDNVSIFGDISANSIVKNVVISGVKISASNTNDIGTAVLANVNNGLINNVVIDGSDVMLLGNMKGAGVVYENNGTINGTIVNISNLLAKSAAGVAYENNGTIANVTTYGKVSAGGSTGEIFAGGIAAINNQLITYSISNMEVFINTADSAYKGIAGGVVAMNAKDITYTYFMNVVDSDCRNSGVETYVAGFVGINDGDIKYSYVQGVKAQVTRKSLQTKIGGFVGHNNGTISNVLSNVIVGKGSDLQNIGAIAYSNTGTMTNIAYHNSKVNGAKIVVQGNEISELVAFESNNVALEEAQKVLGDEFVIDKNLSGTQLLLKNVIYIDNIKAVSVDRNANLTTSSKNNYNVYYLGGVKKAISYDMKTNNYAGMQIITYRDTVKVMVDGVEQDRDIEFNRLVIVK